jgi:hypothetical protein
MPAHRLTRLAGFQIRMLASVLLLRSRPPRILGWMVWLYLVGILLATLIFALPPVRFHLSCWTQIPKSYPDVEAREWIKNWCDSAIIFFQIGITVAVGGVVFTERVVDFIRQRAIVAQNDFNARMVTPDVGERRKRLARFYWTMKGFDARKGGPSPPSRLEIARAWWSHTATILEDIIPADIIAGFGDRLPFFYRGFIFKFAVAFPGGFYGLIAFTMFEGLLVAQVVKTYFDYIPVCSP